MKKKQIINKRTFIIIDNYLHAVNDGLLRVTWFVRNGYLKLMTTLRPLNKTEVMRKNKEDRKLLIIFILSDLLGNAVI